MRWSASARAHAAAVLLGVLLAAAGAWPLARPAGAAPAPAPTAPAGSRSHDSARARPRTRSGTRRARVQLRALGARIRAMSRQSSRDAAERGRLTAQLRVAELALGKARGELDATNRDVAEQEAHRAALSAERSTATGRLAATRAGLAAELRAAYLLGGAAPLRLLLDQRNPLAAQRLMSYYGYLGRAGAQRIARIQGDVRRLDTIDVNLQRQQATLAGLRQTQQQELQSLSSAQAQRQQVLLRLAQRLQTRTQQLAQLRAQQAGLEQLLERLKRAGRSSAEPLDLVSAFGRLRGQLAWPVAGHLTAQFGQTRASGVTWDGVVIDTALDTPVHAVSAGRVVFADWLPGLGLLIIIDHGNGYLSLYAHNDRLLQPVGAAVSAGEVIAQAGDTGGRATPQLYFEIRHAGRPIDPLPWFRSPAP